MSRLKAIDLFELIEVSLEERLYEINFSKVAFVSRTGVARSLAKSLAWHRTKEYARALEFDSRASGQ